MMLRARIVAPALVVGLLWIPLEAAAQPSKGEQKCINALNKSLLKVAQTQIKEICKCIKKGSDGKLPGTIEDCVADDAKNKVAKARAKTEKQDRKRCGDLPPFGFRSANAVNAAGVDMSIDLLHEVFGPDLDAAIIAKAADKNGAKCQQEVAKAIKKCRDTKLQEFGKCKKKGLKDGSITDAAGLEACIGNDAKGKIAKACDNPEKQDKIRKALAKKCLQKDVDLAAALPPCGVTGDVEATHDCLEPLVECQVCLAIDLADGLARDCDDFDDGVDNESCDELPVSIAQREFLPMVIRNAPLGGPTPIVTPGVARRTSSSVPFTSNFQVQNLDSSTATLTITYYGQDGSVAATGGATIPANESWRAFPGINDGATGLPSSFNGSAVISSDNDVAATIIQESSTPFYGSTATSFPSGSTTAYLPLVNCNNAGFNTMFYVQNAGGGDPANVTVEYEAGPFGTSTSEQQTIPMASSFVFDQTSPTTSGLGCDSLSGSDSSFVGSATVTSDQPIVASVVNLGIGSEQSLFSYDGFSDAATTVHVPVIRSDDSGFFTSMQIQNVGTSSTSVSLLYSDNQAGPAQPVTDVTSIPAGESVTFTQDGTSGNNDWDAIGSYNGSATIISVGGPPQPIVAIVNQIHETDTKKASAYNAFADGAGSTSVSFPTVWSNFGGFSSSISIQSTSDDAEVEVTFSENLLQAGETPKKHRFEIPHGGDAKTIFQQGQSGPNDWDKIGSYVGSATATSNVPIIGISNLEGPTSAGDTFFTYNGIAD